MNVGPYFCTKSGCRSDHFTKAVDWGFLDESNGDCESCRKKCQSDKKCRAFECGSTYCSWWARGTCDEISKDTIYSTKKLYRRFGMGNLSNDRYFVVAILINQSRFIFRFEGRK